MATDSDPHSEPLAPLQEWEEGNGWRRIVTPGDNGVNVGPAYFTHRKVALANAVTQLLLALGADAGDPNFERTPERVATWLVEYAETKEQALSDILQPRFPEEHQELVAVTNIAFTALCAHHLLPFRGVAHVGYLPQGTVVGISKLARAVRFFAERLTLQERITQQLADGIMAELAPQGVMVVVKASHQCMTVRGVKDPGTITVTSAVRGVFKENTANVKQEFIALCSNGGGNDPSRGF